MIKTLTLTAALFTSALLSFGAHAEDLMDRSTSELTKIEKTLSNEVYERTCQRIESAKISFFAVSEAKRTADKKAVIDNIYRLVALKNQLEARVKARKSQSVNNGYISVSLSNIKVTGVRRAYYKDPYIPDTTIALGNVAKMQLTSANNETPLNLRMTYCEKGTLFINGHKTKLVKRGSNSVDFEINYNNDDYKVHATLNASKSGWKS